MCRVSDAGQRTRCDIPPAAGVRKPPRKEPAEMAAKADVTATHRDVAV
jgi:hypothetical protein